MENHNNEVIPAMTLDADELARRIAARILETDRATIGLGMRVDAVAAGSVTLSMNVGADMINGHDICHGGYIFTLADSACAIASNSRNTNMVLQSSTITYLNAAHLGDRLTARAEECALRGRSGVIDISVHDQNETLIALFRGLVRSIPGHTLPEHAPKEQG
jgi:acyl-CoA thioesterase